MFLQRTQFTITLLLAFLVTAIFTLGTAQTALSDDHLEEAKEAVELQEEPEIRAELEELAVVEEPEVTEVVEAAEELDVMEEPEVVKEVAPTEELINCLAEKGLVVYGMRTCPACAHFANGFGGYEKIAAFYVECPEHRERCSTEKKTRYVPELQINGEAYQGSRTPADLAKALGCA